LHDKCLAVITARGGSKRIPQKNIKNFFGKPIIQYTIDAANQSGVFDEVMVSTDSVEIKSIAESCGAKVPFLRSKNFSSDTATTANVLLEVIDEYKKRGEVFTYICCAYPTAPFITAEQLRKCRALLNETTIDGVVPIVAYSFPPQRSFIIRNGKVQYQWPENQFTRSQDLEKWYHDCGQFYFLKVVPFLSEKSLVLKNSVPMIVNESQVQDIDTYDDWELAELKFQKWMHNNQS